MENTTIYALALGAALTGCQSPLETIEGGENIVRIPNECHEVLALVESEGPRWSLTCKKEDGGEIFYKRNSNNEVWKRYGFRRE